MAKRLTPDELRALPLGTQVWEHFIDGATGTVELALNLRVFRDQLMSAEGFVGINDKMCDPYPDGSRWIWWDSRPTPEEMEEAKHEDA